MNRMPVKLPEKIDGFRSEPINALIDYCSALTPIVTPAMRQEFRHDGVASYPINNTPPRIQFFRAHFNHGHIPYGATETEVKPPPNWAFGDALAHMTWNMSPPTSGTGNRTYIHPVDGDPTKLQFTKPGQYVVFLNLRLFWYIPSDYPSDIGPDVWARDSTGSYATIRCKDRFALTRLMLGSDCVLTISYQTLITAVPDIPLTINIASGVDNQDVQVDGNYSTIMVMGPYHDPAG